MKEKLKNFWEDHKAAIIGGGATAIWLVAYLLYVKHNTTDLPEIDVPGGKCFGMYEQFGERVLNVDVPLCCVADFARRLREEGHFSDNAEFLVSVTESI